MEILTRKRRLEDQDPVKLFKAIFVFHDTITENSKFKSENVYQAVFHVAITKNWKYLAENVFHAQYHFKLDASSVSHIAITSNWKYSAERVFETQNCVKLFELICWFLYDTITEKDNLQEKTSSRLTIMLNYSKLFLFFMTQ